MKHAYVFPGQGAQAVGMGKDLYDNVPEAKELFEKANSDIELLRVLPEIIRRCCTIKAHYVEIDPTGKKERRLLDFGHTIGGAIERCCRYDDKTITHGEATAIGMYLVTKRAELLGLTTRGATSRLEYVLKSLSLPTETHIAPEILAADMAKSKHVKEGKLQLALMKEIGDPLGLSIANVSTLWTLSRPEVAAAIIGTRSSRHVDGNAALIGRTLPPEGVARIDAFLAGFPTVDGDCFDLERLDGSKHRAIMRMNLVNSVDGK